MFNQGNAAIQQEIQVTLEELEGFIRKGDVLDRLLANPDFQEIILEGYCKNEAHRIALASGNPNLQSAESQADLFSQVKGIGHLMAYLRSEEKKANSARKEKKENQEALVELENSPEE